MTLGQLQNTGSGRGGVMRTEPIVLQTVNSVLSLSHAMDRPPELILLQLTNLTAEMGWLPGESLNLYESSTAGNWQPTLLPGRVTVTFPASLSITNKATNSISTLSVAKWNVALICVWFAPLQPSL